MITEQFRSELDYFEKQRPRVFFWNTAFFIMVLIYLAGVLYLESGNVEVKSKDFLLYAGCFLGYGFLMFGLGQVLKNFNDSYHKDWYEKVISKVFPDCSWEEIPWGRRDTRHLICLHIPGLKVWESDGFWHQKEYEIKYRPILFIVGLMLPLGLWGISYLPEPLNADLRPVFIYSLIGASAVMIWPVWSAARESNKKLTSDPLYREFPDLDEVKRIGRYEIHSIHQSSEGTTVKLVTSSKIIPHAHQKFTDERTYRHWLELKEKLEKFKAQFALESRFV